MERITSFTEYLLAKKTARGRVRSKLIDDINTSGSLLNERKWQVKAQIKRLKKLIMQIPIIPLNGRSRALYSLGNNTK